MKRPRVPPYALVLLTVAVVTAGFVLANPGRIQDALAGDADPGADAEPSLVVTFELIDPDGAVAFRERMTWDDSLQTLHLRPFTVASNEYVIYGREQRIQITVDGTIRTEGLDGSPILLVVTSDLTSKGTVPDPRSKMFKDFPGTGGNFNAKFSYAWRDDDSAPQGKTCKEDIPVKITAIATGKTTKGDPVKGERTGSFRLTPKCQDIDGAGAVASTLVELSVLPGFILREAGDAATARTVMGVVS